MRTGYTPSLKVCANYNVQLLGPPIRFVGIGLTPFLPIRDGNKIHTYL